jgi:glycosyltransferase involved in cell wall biosynthesis
MHEPFTLLLSVYDGDRPDFLERAFRSAVDGQTLPPDQVVIVRDGPVREELAACLDRLQGGSPVPVTMVALERNRGLGPALDSGLAASRHDVIARMDADDVAMPERFARQAAALDAHPNVAALGSACLVIGHDDTTLGHRNPPTEPAVIHAMLRQGNCMIHPTMMLRRAAVLDAGGYRPAFRLAEDFDLWLRLSERHDLMNLPECLLSYRQHAAQSSWQDVEQRALSELGALVVAEQRRAGMEDPAGRVPLVTRAFLQAIGVPEAAITRHITVRAMDAAKEAIAAGHRASARETIGLLLRQPGLHPRTRLHAWLLRLRS